MGIGYKCDLCDGSKELLWGLLIKMTCVMALKDLLCEGWLST